MMMAMSEVFQWPEFLPAFGRAAEEAGFLPHLLAETDAGPLVAWERPGDGPRVYLSSGIHGDEPAGPLVLLDLMSGGFFTPDKHWLVCPALNPTGLAAGLRENAAGIDLNRDYLLRATSSMRSVRGFRRTPGSTSTAMRRGNRAGFSMRRRRMSPVAGRRRFSSPIKNARCRLPSKRPLTRRSSRGLPPNARPFGRHVGI